MFLFYTTRRLSLFKMLKKINWFFMGDRYCFILSMVVVFLILIERQRYLVLSFAKLARYLRMYICLLLSSKL